MKRSTQGKAIALLLALSLLAALPPSGVSSIGIPHRSVDTVAEGAITNAPEELCDSRAETRASDWPPEFDFPPWDFILTEYDYMLFDDANHGGWFYDAEKTLDNDDDDLLCWAAAASNALEWTGWGVVDSFIDTDDMFRHYQEYWQDVGGNALPAWEWWFDNSSYTMDKTNIALEKEGGGNFWPSENFSAYHHEEWNLTKMMSGLDEFLHSGYAVTLSIYPVIGVGGHALTVWGYRYSLIDPDYYTGIWITDSDDNKNMNSTDPPINRLRLVEVDYDDENGWWVNHNSGWYISGVIALAPRPGARPVAVAGTLYESLEGYGITFDGSGSYDPDGVDLLYRWDFNNDGFWDTPFADVPYVGHIWYDEYEGTVLLEVFDGVFKDVGKLSVKITNSPPIVNAYSDTVVDEGSAAYFYGSFTDPGLGDGPFTVVWDFGDGSPVVTGTVNSVYTYSEILYPSHVYADDGVYTATLSVTDRDGGTGTDKTNVTVLNVAPSITASEDTIYEDGYATVSGEIDDPGILDTFTLMINWGDGTVKYYTYPAGAKTFSETHQYLDDEPTGTPSDTYPIKIAITDDYGYSGSAFTYVLVKNAVPVVEPVSVVQPNPQFVLPKIHEVKFTAGFSDVGTLDTHEFWWDFGDGSPLETGTLAAAHTYDAPGEYTATFTVVDDDTGSASMRVVIYVSTPEEALQETNAYIQTLGDGCFKNKPAQTKNALENVFSSLLKKIAAGNYRGAISSLLNDVRAKADGAVGGNPLNDWITDPAAQRQICRMIDDMVEYLRLFL